MNILRAERKWLSGNDRKLFPAMFPLDLNDLAHNFSLVYGRDKRTDGRTDGRMDRRNAMRITM